MNIRIFQLRSSNPLVGAVLVTAAVGLVAAFALFGLMVLAGLTAVGAVGLLARRVLGIRRRPPSTIAPLDPSQEVFPPSESRPQDQLPPGAN